MDYPKFIVSNQQEESISAYRVKKYHTSLLSLSRLETCDLNFSTVAVDTASQRWGVTDGSTKLTHFVILMDESSNVPKS